MQESQIFKRRPPHSITLASETELVTTGGELEFVSRMLYESVQLAAKNVATKKTWYTSMFGKLESLKEFVQKLRELELDNYVVTEFVQAMTRRWAVAWRFGFDRPAPNLTRPGFNDEGSYVSTALKGLLPPLTGCTIELHSDKTVDQKLSLVHEILLEYEEFMHLVLKSYTLTGTSDQGNVWSRSFRRRKRQKLEHREIKAADTTFRFQISVMGTSTLLIQWIFGSSAVTFESFCGMLKKKIQERNV